MADTLQSAFYSFLFALLTISYKDITLWAFRKLVLCLTFGFQHSHRFTQNIQNVFMNELPILTLFKIFLMFSLMGNKFMSKVFDIRGQELFSNLQFYYPITIIVKSWGIF